MRSHPNWAHTRATATMRNSKGFVQVEVTDVGTDVSRVGKANLGVHVGAIHVDLTAVGMNNTGDLDDAFFIYTVRRRICNHDTCKDIFEFCSNRA